MSRLRSIPRPALACAVAEVPVCVAGGMNAFVASGRYRRILVITTDRVVDEADRMTNFALFSDGAASCVVSADEEGDGYRLVACATAQEAKSLEWSNELSSDTATPIVAATSSGRGVRPRAAASCERTVSASTRRLPSTTIASVTCAAAAACGNNARGSEVAIDTPHMTTATSQARKTDIPHLKST